eukprot:12732907-Heterocapsa_arctica.AAC.1
MSLSPSIYESLCPSLLLFAGVVSCTSLSMFVLAKCLLRWAAWAKIATVKGHDEKHDHEHETSAMGNYAA